MASPPNGYRYGPIVVVKMAIDKDSADIVAGDYVDNSGATAGYILQADAGDVPLGVAWETMAAGTADGDAWVLVDISPLSVYEYPADTGTVSQGLCNLTADLGGAQSINIDASTDDCVRIVAVDIEKNTCFVQRVANIGDAGVV